MRFTFINPKKKAPSFRAKYDAYALASLAIAQILTISFVISALWYFMPLYPPAIAGLCAIAFLSAAFFVAYSSVQNAHLVGLTSLLGLEVLSIGYLPKWIGLYVIPFNPTIFGIDDYLLLLGFFDFIVITIIFYANTIFPPGNKSG
ncbi:MAG: hypothetical protein V1822_02920 [Candidatus Micrarchaeota archaeon]